MLPDDPKPAGRTAIIILILLGLFIAAGCAKIGEPQPPEIRIPKAASDLAIRQLSDFVVLTVSKPVQNTDGSEATTLRSLDVLRLAEHAETADSGKPLPDDEFLAKAVRILSIPSSSFPAYLKDGTYVIEDRLALPEKSDIYLHAFRYAVVFLNNRNQTAGLSNQVVIKPVPIPHPPTGLEADVTEKAIRLKWVQPSGNADGSKPPRIAGYNVFRSEQPDQVPAHPVNSAPVQQPEYEDRDFRFDTVYHYSVSTVASVRNPYAQSLPSESLAVASRDVFPPAPPEDFSAILEGNIVILLWVPSPSPDTAGYTIYRHDKKTLSKARIHEELIRTPRFRDEVGSEADYEYSIHAVDTHGNESVPVRAGVEKP